MNRKNNTISSNFITFNWNNRSQMNHKYARNVHRFAAIALVLNEWKCTIILCLRSKCQYWKHANIPLSIPQMDKYTLIPILLLPPSNSLYLPILTDLLPIQNDIQPHGYNWMLLACKMSAAIWNNFRDSFTV